MEKFGPVIRASDQPRICSFVFKAVLHAPYNFIHCFQEQGKPAGAPLASSLTPNGRATHRGDLFIPRQWRTGCFTHPGTFAHRGIHSVRNIGLPEVSSYPERPHTPVFFSYQDTFIINTNIWACASPSTNQHSQYIGKMQHRWASVNLLCKGKIQTITQLCLS